jgi:predicted DNA-binding protein
MAVKGRSAERIRLSLDVSPELNELLERMASDTHSTKSDVLRKAIALMDLAVDAKRNGQRLFISDAPPPDSAREIIGI